MKKKKKQPAFLSVCPVEGVLNDVIHYCVTDNGFSLLSIEDVIYNDSVINKLKVMTDGYTNGRKRELLYRFIVDLNNKRVAKVITWLFKNRINTLFKNDDRKEKHPIEDSFILIIKELLWTSYYIRNKPIERLKIIGSPIDILTRLQGVYLDANYMLSQYSTNREEYVDNILSLKNSQLGFLPYPNHIDPDDLETLLSENKLLTKKLRIKIRALKDRVFTPDERFTVFDELRTIVKEKLEEKANGRVTQNNKYVWCMDPVHQLPV